MLDYREVALQRLHCVIIPIPNMVLSRVGCNSLESFLLGIQDKKRIEIENRVEDERLAVREEMAAQRKELFTQRKSQKREVMELERKMHIVESVSEELL